MQILSHYIVIAYSSNYFLIKFYSINSNNKAVFVSMLPGLRTITELLYYIKIDFRLYLGVICCYK